MCRKEIVFCNAVVVSANEILPEIFRIEVRLPVTVASPVPGQFFMLRALPSAILLCRPISVFSYDFDTHTVVFLILQKGSGTHELCALTAGDELEILGPQGNSFTDFLPDDFSNECSGKIALLGAGIGVAPVAGFAASLKPKSYDFYASFRNSVYGLENVCGAETVITTEDGSAGIKGMLSASFTAEVIAARKYRAVYACGPEPMLAYVQTVCAQAKIPCYLSMESKMACGMGACLGCTIATTQGNKRCCVDGPVFLGEIVQFKSRIKSVVSSGNVQSGNMQSVNRSGPDLSVMIAGVTFKNPIIAASGTFGYGTEYAPFFDVGRLGGICSKGLTFAPKSGNAGIRLCETNGGLINSIGLENPGIQHFIENELPTMLKTGATVIANLSGSSIETYIQGAALLDATPVPMIELNISCPNVKAGGMAFGLDPKTAAAVVSAVKAVTTKPLMVKLSPNAPQLCDVAESVVRAGADVVSLVNTFQALAINIETGRPVFDNVTAGLAGPAIKPLALRMVWDVCRRIKSLPKELQIPVVGLGGIQTATDALEFIMAGAAAVQIGTATFADPFVMIKIIEGIHAYMTRKSICSLEEIRGCVL